MPSKTPQDFKGQLHDAKADLDAATQAREEARVTLSAAQENFNALDVIVKQLEQVVSGYTKLAEDKK